MVKRVTVYEKEQGELSYEMPLEQIAKELGVSRQAVDQMLKRIYKKLRPQLAAYEDYFEGREL